MLCAEFLRKAETHKNAVFQSFISKTHNIIIYLAFWMKSGISWFFECDCLSVIGILVSAFFSISSKRILVGCADRSLWSEQIHAPKSFLIYMSGTPASSMWTASLCLKWGAPHFRHAKASHWLEDGINVVQVSFLLGHEQLETTMRYLDISTEDKIKALATLEDETQKTVPRKWKNKNGTLTNFCGLQK